MVALEQSDIDQWTELRGLWRKDPVSYAIDRIGLPPTVQQRQLLTAIAPPNSRVTCRAGHGVGKSTALAITVMWFLECFDYSRIPCTASSASQLRQVLWAEIAKIIRTSDATSVKNGLPEALFLSKLFRQTEDKVADVGRPNDWFAAARTARKENPDALQGFHASDMLLSEDGTEVVREGEDGSLLYIADEASGIPDEIFIVAEGALSSIGSRLLMVGNPTRASGYFYDSHNKNRSSYTCLHFSCDDSPLSPKSYRADMERKYGVGSNIVRVRVEGEFPKQDDDSLIALALVEEALARDKQPISGRRRLGIDVARFGDDRTTFVGRQDSNIFGVRVYSKQDTMTTVGYAVDFIKKNDIEDVYVDVIGVGAGVFDRLYEQRKKLGINVYPVSVSNKAPWQKDAKPEDGLPAKMRDFVWMQAAKFFQLQQPSFAMCDKDLADDLALELSSVKYKFDSNGKIVVETKQEMKDRGLRSPDLADALCLTFAPEKVSSIIRAPFVARAPIASPV